MSDAMHNALVASQKGLRSSLLHVEYSIVEDLMKSNDGENDERSRRIVSCHVSAFEARWRPQRCILVQAGWDLRCP